MVLLKKGCKQNMEVIKASYLRETPLGFSRRNPVDIGDGRRRCRRPAATSGHVGIELSFELNDEIENEPGTGIRSSSRCGA